MAGKKFTSGLGAARTDTSLEKPLKGPGCTGPEGRRHEALPGPRRRFPRCEMAALGAGRGARLGQSGGRELLPQPMGGGRGRGGRALVAVGGRWARAEAAEAEGGVGLPEAGEAPWFGGFVT